MKKGFTRHTRWHCAKARGSAAMPSACAGFTLIETIVAITILTLAVAGPLFTASRAVVAARAASYQLTASYLAQEGVEYVRMMRDNEYLLTMSSTTGWNNFLSGTDAASITSCRATTCMLDPTQPMGTGSGYSLQPCSGAACVPLRLTSANTYTQQSGVGTATIFTRTIKATDVTVNEEKIVSTVTWNFHNIPYTVTVTDHLTPWQSP